MHIEIINQTTLNEIQEAFVNYFPYLKIEFYRQPHKKYKASPEEERLDPFTCIGDLQPGIVLGHLQILPGYKVAAIEKEFQDRFGLSVQIFRKEKNGWEQTTGMDDFTLKQLNEFGRDSSDEKIVSDYTQELIEPEEKPEKLL